MAQVFWVTKKDRIMGVLPLFHSFGFTATQWFPLLTGFGVVYHANPTDSKTIGEMVFKYKATIIISTPTFYTMYIRRCSAEEFSSLRYAIVGAEKLREPVAKAFREKYGVELLEGYGCTEMGPVISINIPNVEQGANRQLGLKPGTVGHPIPGVSAKVVHPDTGEVMASSEEGLLLVKGPGRMVGYLGQAKLTEEVLRDGWYVTGDIASVDPDGFIRITDRLSRFSKIGGEMVHKLRQTDLPNIWIPRGENLYYVDAIPLLGSGKVDLKQVKMMAMERAGG
jgi:acyl-[acyl-carrier-protein]-phospholipid O-acyltransferase/long-chain-fatty-acid--[acyl-carrier-protein] ligase